MSTDILCPSTLDQENKKFATDCNGKTTVRTMDDCAIDVLNAILAAVGGTPVGSVVKTIFNETIALANTEQSLVMPVSIVGYLIRSRGGGSIKLSHVSGESGTKFMTVPGRATHTDSHNYDNLTIYFQSSLVGDIIEIISWE